MAAHVGAETLEILTSNGSLDDKREQLDLKRDLHRGVEVQLQQRESELKDRRNELEKRLHTLDVELREALLKAVAVDPADRYPSVLEFQRALVAYLGLGTAVLRGQATVALIVGGSIVIPHLRHAFDTIDQLRAEKRTTSM